MGSRGRSIRLRIYVLVAIPLVTMIGLLAYVATTSIHNAMNLDRAPSLINATSVPTALFVNLLQNERRAAVVYIFQPNAANLVAYQHAITQTNAGQQTFINAMNSSGTKNNADANSAKSIQDVVAALSQLPGLRQGVEARQLPFCQPTTALCVLGAYSQPILGEPKLFLAEADSMTNATAASQALGLIATVSAREALSQEDALLAGMLAATKASQADRVAFTEMASTRQGYILDADNVFDATNLAIYNAAFKGAAGLQQQLGQIEQAVVGGVPMAQMPVNLAQWDGPGGLASTLLQDHFAGGVNDAQAQLTVDRVISHAAWVRVAFTSGIAFAGLVLTILMTTLVGRSIIRRLRGLETTALTLAEKQLPDVVGRLRRGDDVDVATEAPPMRVGADEIGRVGQAFDLVRQTAIRSAVEEARLRRGLNDVFRSLARRSQSLLHRQLTLLDQMERRASDPEALDDLFRLDHLTTRMRRHAEGLVILAGAPAGRGWSSPVRMVDVMRGAIAEVEDYARVSVATRSQAALSGSAVADVIHLLAELIENATTLSPPYTSVRVSGDTVANGFAIEVEDRGLGMSTERLAELNQRLESPPEFNPSDSEQLGLFVVSQLARRHGIRVTLKASPYGGTEAVALIPRHLVVAEEAFRASLPGEPSAAAISAGGPGARFGHAGTNGNHYPPAELGPGAGAGAFPGGPYVSGGSPGGSETPVDQDTQITGGPRISGALRRTHGSIPDGLPRGGHHASRPGSNGGSLGGGALGGGALGAGNGHGSAGHESGGNGAEAGPGDLPRRTRGPADTGMLGGPQQPYDVFSGQGGETPGPSSSPFGSPSAPYSTGPSTSFPGWQGGGPVTPMTPVASGPAGAGVTGVPGTPGALDRGGASVSRPPWELTPEDGPLPVASEPAEPLSPDGDGQSGGDFEGLPRRVRQASIAPQLRGDPATRQRPTPAANDTGGAGQPSGPSPDEIRATMSALQRGWQEGRSQRAAASEPPWETEPAEGETDGA